MAKSKINLTEDQEKEIIKFYLVPNSMNDTVEKFSLPNRYQLKKILDKYGVEQHSVEVKRKLQKQNAENTCLERFGVKCNFASKDPKLNGKSGMIEKYGVEHPYQSQELFNKMLIAKLEKYGDKNYNNPEKMKITCDEIYGGIGYASAELREKGFDTCEELYGSRTYNNRESAAKTFKNKYGSAHAPKYIYQVMDVFFDSFPEVCFYLYHKSLNKNIQRIVEPYTYEYNNKTWNYFPDFKIDNIVYEIKGDQFLDEDGSWKNPFDYCGDQKAKAKFKCAIENNVKILYSKDYQCYIDWFYQQGYKKEDFKIIKVKEE